MHQIQAPDGHHFYGHAAFSSDGALLFTTENHIESGAGWIGVWDRSLRYQRVDAFRSGGIGPHEILRLASGDLAVANGGIRTHPKTGREKLNLATMRPNLSVFAPDGTLKDQAEVPGALHQNSLRHIAATPDGAVFCGFQWQGDPYDAPPLVAQYQGDGSLHMGAIEDALLFRLDGYIGSVCASETMRLASSPRGGALIAFDEAGHQVNSFRAVDLCGLCPLTAQTCLATDGTGAVHEVTPSTLTRLNQYPLAFDNHLTALT